MVSKEIQCPAETSDCRLKSFKLWPVLCAAEAVVILCLCAALNTDINIRKVETLYAEPDLSAVVWTEEKIPFSESNSYYAEREARFMRFPGGPVDLCCFGDSITQLFEWQDAFPGLLVSNRGIGNDTTEGMLARLDSIVATKARVISIMAGANDMGQDGWTPEGIAENVRAMLEELRVLLPDAKFIINSMLPTSAEHPNRPEDMQAVNQ